MSKWRLDNNIDYMMVTMMTLPGATWYRPTLVLPALALTATYCRQWWWLNDKWVTNNYDDDEDVNHDGLSWLSTIVKTEQWYSIQCSSMVDVLLTEFVQRWQFKWPQWQQPQPQEQPQPQRQQGRPRWQRMRQTMTVAKTTASTMTAHHNDSNNSRNHNDRSNNNRGNNDCGNNETTTATTNTATMKAAMMNVATMTTVTTTMATNKQRPPSISISFCLVAKTLVTLFQKSRYPLYLHHADRIASFMSLQQSNVAFKLWLVWIVVMLNDTWRFAWFSSLLKTFQCQC